MALNPPTPVSLTADSDLLNGLVPSVDDNNFIYVIGLIGTTVVPYNLFLHSYVSKNKWKNTAMI